LLSKAFRWRNRSDRDGEKPTTTLAFEAGVINWLPVRGFHHGPRPPRAP
jgi:hypothetical protein